MYIYMYNCTIIYLYTLQYIVEEWPYEKLTKKEAVQIRNLKFFRVSSFKYSLHVVSCIYIYIYQPVCQIISFVIIKKN